MQDNPAPSPRKPTFRPRKCLDCPAMFTPTGTQQVRCLDCGDARAAIMSRATVARRIVREKAARAEARLADPGKKRDYSGRVYRDRECKDCHAVFTPRGSGPKYCPACQRKRRREQTKQGLTRMRERRRVPAYCVDCGVELLPPHHRGNSGRCLDCRPEYLLQKRRGGRPARVRRVAAARVCLDCTTLLLDLRQRCPDCRAAHEDRLRAARAERVRAKYARKPRTSWAPTGGLGLRVCTSCSEEFQPYRRNQLECSYACRDAVGRVRAHGLTPEQHGAMLVEQDGVCALCGNAPYPKPDNPASAVLNIDHDHSTGQVRGLLCARCNLGLGNFADDPELLRRAADYIDHARADFAA